MLQADHRDPRGTQVITSTVTMLQCLARVQSKPTDVHASFVRSEQIPAVNRVLEFRVFQFQPYNMCKNMYFNFKICFHFNENV